MKNCWRNMWLKRPRNPPASSGGNTSGLWGAAGVFSFFVRGAAVRRPERQRWRIDTGPPASLAPDYELEPKRMEA